MSDKPSEILELEKRYDKTFKVVDNIHTLNYNFLEGDNLYTYCLDSNDNLIGLNIINANIQKIDDLPNLPYLIHLNLNDNEIEKIESLSKFKNLKQLFLNKNRIKKIENLDTLVNLNKLSLEDNSIEIIEKLDSLVKLYDLSLTGNKISKIENLDSLVNLRFLGLGSNKIARIENLESLVRLTGLYLSFNKIRKIENLNELINLTFLYLSYNQLLKMENLSYLKNIDTLSLSGNNFTRIEGLNDLTKLSSLKLTENLIENLEDILDIMEFKEIKEIDISLNPIVDNLDLKLDSKDNHLSIILSKLNEINETQKSIILPVKIMLLGNHAAGKSTFLEYLQTGKINNRNTSTPILKIQEYPLKKNKNKLPEAVIYDFGGQDYYHGMYQAFFSLDSINLLLWNLESDNNDIRIDSNNTYTRDFSKGYWLSQLKYAFKKEKKYYKVESVEPTFLVQTHADIDHRFTWENKNETHPVINEFYISLHKNNFNTNVNIASLNYLKESVLYEIKRKQIDELKPAWYEQFLGYILNKKSKKSVRLNTIMKYYNRENITNKAKRQFLQADLEQLALKGLVLYYKNDKQLKDVAWLNPSKIVEYLHSNILSHDMVKRKNGKLSQADWKKICNDEKLERLLILEKVIFFDRANIEYIVPNYLQLAQEDKHYNLLAFGFVKSNFTLKFKFFIPFGIINQMICLFGNNPNYKAFWRDQLIFTYKNSKVFVKLDFKFLTISVFIQSEKPYNIEKEIFDIILKLYNNEDIDSDDHRVDEIIDVNILKSEYTSGLSLKSINEKKQEIRQYKYNSPQDMYLSLDEKWFIHHGTLDDSVKTQTKVKAYKLIDNLIDESQSIEQSSMLYNNFTTNEKIKQMKKIFISYSRKDIDYKNELKKHLQMLQTFDIADTWSCEDITVGKWDAQIQKELEESDLIIYMLSANFFSSRYILEKEVSNIIDSMREIELAKKKDILCIIVSDFVGLDKLKYSLAKRSKSDLQNNLLQLSEYQYLPYDRVKNNVSNNEEERIISLKSHTNRNTIETALTQITNKVLETLSKYK